MFDKKNSELIELLYDIQQYKKQNVEPIIVEFSGLPRTGKSSCIENIATVLRRVGFSVKIVREWGEVCPLNDKHSPVFNLWTVSHTIINILESGIIHSDILLLDRGIYDAICWFRWMKNQNYITENDEEKFKNFLLWEGFKQKINLVCSFIAKPEVALSRERSPLLLDCDGRIMNHKVLEQYLFAIQEINKENLGLSKIINIDTTYQNNYETSIKIIKELIDILKEQLTEKIGCIKLSTHIKKQWLDTGISKVNELNNIPFEFVNRVDAERNSKIVQIVTIATFYNKEKQQVALFRKKMLFK